MPKAVLDVSRMTERQLWQSLENRIIDLEPGNLQGIEYRRLRMEWSEAISIAKQLRLRGTQLTLLDSA